jgi:endonuclease YncB( thermonuclease family)
MSTYYFTEKVGGLEKETREARKGLWAELYPVMPWEGRKGLLPKGKS